MTFQSPRYGSAADHRRSLLPHAPYPLSAPRSEPLWHSIAAAALLPIAAVCMILIWWGMGK